MSLGVVCPGQGAQSPAMFALLDGHLAEAPALRACARVLGRDLDGIIAAAGDAFLQRNAVAQPLLCAYQLTVWSLLREALPAPRAFAGYSIGEFAAYGCAGAFDPEATVAIAAFRAQAMDAACSEPCGMAAVRGLSRRRLEPLAAAHGVEIAIVNAPDRIVVGGRSAGLQALLAELAPLGASVTPLAVHIASHTSLMASAAAALRRRLQQTAMAAPAVPVLAGIDGLPVYQPARAVETLSQQACQTIDWAACLQGLSEAGCRVILELGPGADLARMVRDNLPGIEARSVAEFHTLAGALQWVRRHLD